MTEARRGSAFAQWRVARITPLGEFLQPTRITGTAIRLVTQAFLVTFLWRALYANTETSAGMRQEQTVTYAVLAVLATQIRGLDREPARDTLLQHVQTGTIVYWFLRPLSPRRYYLIRAIGDQVYGLAWVVAGFLICLAVGAVQPPAPGAGWVFLLSMCCAQVIVYQLLLVVDLICFWTFQNQAGLMILRFVQNLLSGVIAPLWFFPGWFLLVSWVLPFRYTLDVPLSFYVGRLEPSDAPYVITAQLLWCVVLGLLTRFLWQRAAVRVTIQGG